MDKDLYIFDLDGTIADLSHRLKFIKVDNKKKKNWPAFKNGIPNDQPIVPMIKLLKQVYNNENNHVLFLSGREGTNRSVRQTEEWILEHTRIKAEHNVNLFMRQEKDYRNDTIIKKEILYTKVIPIFGKPLMLFDDRLSVCKMWMDEGLFTLCVNQGFHDF